MSWIADEPVDPVVIELRAFDAGQAGWDAQARTAVMTTSATSLGWEIMTTCEAPSISVISAPMRS
jgi:hypothetical protein